MITPVDLCKEIYELIDKINEEYTYINYEMFDEEFFKFEEKKDLVKESNELTFEKIALFMYKLIFERAESNIKFLKKMSHLYSSDDFSFEDSVHAFRTVIGHYLSDSVHDKKINQKYNFWFMTRISKNEAETEDEWGECSIQLINEAKIYLELLFGCLNCLVNMSDKTIFTSWYIMQRHNVPKYKIVEIVDELKVDYDFHFDTERFIQINKTRIDESIKLIDSSEYKQFEKDLCNSIERILLLSDVLPCPISGKQLSIKFGIEKKSLAIVMRAMLKFYNNNKQTTEKELLNWVGKFINDGFH